MLVDGADIEIPEGITITLDTNTANLSGLTIGGTLQFAEQDVALTSDWIMVQGTLQVGAEGNLFTHQAVITLTGDPAIQNIMGMGTRGIMVMGGTLELHDTSPQTIWSKIDGHIAAGASQLNAVEATGWQIGDQIVIAPTDYYGVAETEDFVLTATN